MIFEIAFVLVLVVVNGLLAMSELAVVSARTSRLKVMADRGSAGARAAMTLAADPGRFLSAVQIGITLVGILAGAVSGATIGARLAEALAGLGVPPRYAEPAGVGLVVLLITYLSLIVGELVPKQIALRAPERVAALVAPTMVWIARLTLPLVWLLDRSGELVLRLLGQSGKPESDVSDEELRMIIAEAESAGVIETEEKAMIAGVMRIADRTAAGLMTPRRDVQMLDITDPPRLILKALRNSEHSHLPVHDGSPDSILGVVRVRDVLARQTGRAFADLRQHLRPALRVGAASSALVALEGLRASPSHLVLVYDEHGHFEGLITPMDVLGAITGHFDEDEDEDRMVQRPDGTLLVAGWMPVDEFADHIGITLPDERGYETVAGLLLEAFAHIPKPGERVEVQGVGIEVVDMDGARIDKVLVTPRA